jgi:hypothetical protein
MGCLLRRGRAWRLDWSALLGLLLLLILQLLAALLHILQKLLRAAALSRGGDHSWTAHGRFRLFHRLGILLCFILAALVGLAVVRLTGGYAGLGGEHQFARCPISRKSADRP